jgi:hypothetical protein
LRSKCQTNKQLSLDWGYSGESERSLDEYELQRSSERVSHYTKLRVNKYRRRNILAYQWGHSMEELAKARRVTRRLQHRRIVTRMMLPLHLAEEMFLGMMNLGRKEKRERG